MWLAMNDAYLSIVRKPNTPPHFLTVRARIRGDIQRVFPGAKVKESWDTDYRFRALIKDSDVAAVLAQRIMRLSYSNFKDSVKEHDRHQDYFRIWSVMHSAQIREERRERAGKLGYSPVALPWDEDRDF